MTTPKTQFPVVPAESYTPRPRREPDGGVAPRTPRMPSTAHVGLLFLVLTLVGFVALGAALPRYTLSSTARRGLTYDTLFAELQRLPYGNRDLEAFECDNTDNKSPSALVCSSAGIY